MKEVVNLVLGMHGVHSVGDHVGMRCILAVLVWVLVLPVGPAAAPCLTGVLVHGHRGAGVH